MNFIDRIFAAFNAHSGRNAFCIGDVFYTYDQLFSMVSSVASAIQQQHPHERKIGVVVTDSIETYAAVLAALLTGRTYIPIHPTHPADRTDRIIEQAKLKLVLANGDGFSFTGITMLNTTPLLGMQVAKVSPADFSGITADNAYILFTSGSTGIPKGVPISYHNLNSFVDAFFALGYQSNEQDRFLQMFDLTFDLSVMSYLIPLCIGACVYTVPAEGMKFMNIYNIMEEHTITFALMVPSILANLRPYFDEMDFPQMKYSLFCGEALHTDVTREWMKCVPNAVVENVYGPTEATIFCLTYNVPREGEISDYNGIISIGQAMEGMEAITVDADGNVLPDMEKGELCLYGHQLTTGYLSAEKNIGVFFESDGKKYYRTGDIAYKDPLGNFMYSGRVDHQVKVQGYRIELSEIEFHLRDTVKEVNVVALAIDNNKQLTEIHVVFEGSRNYADEVMAGLKTRVPSYMMPSHIHSITTFPLNANGKTDRKELSNIFKAI